jgi:hypothetical protein
MDTFTSDGTEGVVVTSKVRGNPRFAAPADQLIQIGDPLE